MKKFIPIIILILSLCCLGMSPAFLQMVTGGGSCSEPNGDVAIEGFEGTGYENGVCGSADCWAETSTPNEDFTLAGLSGSVGDPTRNCTSGLQVVGAGANIYGELDTGVNTAAPYMEFSYYLDSESMTDNVTAIAWGSSAADASDWIASIQIVDSGGSLSIRGHSDAGDSTSRAISLDTWYYIKAQFIDNGNGTIWVGTTYGGTNIANGDTWTCNNVTSNPRYYGFGAFSNQTITGVFGYAAVDDDGTF